MVWQTKKLDEVCDIFNGLWTGKKPPYIDVAVIRNTNFTKDGFLDDSNIANLRVEVKQYKNRKLKFGDLILEKSGGGPKQPVGRIIIFDKKDGEYSFSNFTSAVRIKDEKELDYNFLHRFLYFQYISGITETMQRRSTGIRNLQLKEYKGIKIPLPLLPEQLRIVKILDEVFADVARAKTNAEKNLQNSKELFESYLQSVFANPRKDWEEKSLEELGRITSSKRIYKKEYIKTGIPFYRIKEIKELANDKGISLELFISKKRYNEIKKTFGVPLVGDVLMTAVGTIGEIYVINNKDEFYFKDGNILWFKNFKSIDSYFLKYVLMSFVEQIKKLSKGSAYNALTIEKIKKHKIFIPKLREQKSIVKKLDVLSEKTKKLEKIYQQKIADLEELKKSILKKAFSEEL